MRVKVKLFANLASLTPLGVRERVLNVKKGASVGDLLDKLKISPDITNVIVINGVQVDRTTRLEEGDEISVFPPIAGG